MRLSERKKELHLRKDRRIPELTLRIKYPLLTTINYMDTMRQKTK